MTEIQPDTVKTVWKNVMESYDKAVDNQTCAIVFVGRGLIKFSHIIIA